MTGKYNAANSIEISMKKAKAKSKQLGYTFNDLVLGILSKVLKEYFVSKEDKTDSITLSLPFTLQTIPRNVKDYVYHNNFSILTIYFKLIDNFDEAVKSG